MFYCFDTVTGKRTSLGTSNKAEAERLINAKNQAVQQPTMNMEMARVYSSGNLSTAGSRFSRASCVRLNSCRLNDR